MAYYSNFLINTSTYDINTNDGIPIYYCDATSGNISITLSNTLIYPGFVYTFIKCDNTTHTITFNASGSGITINGGASYTLPTGKVQCVLYIYNNNWISVVC